MRLIVLFILWTLYFAFHSILADIKVKAWLEEKIPGFMPFYRLFYNVIAVGGLLLLWMYQRGIAQFQLFDMPLFAYVGIFLVVLGGIIGGIALLGYSLGEFSGLAYINGEKESLEGSLKTNGMNAWVRHPLYFATLLIFWGWFAWKQTDVSLVLGIVVSLYLVIGSLLEEKKLLEAFGEEYRLYQKKVKMLIPFIL